MDLTRCQRIQAGNRGTNKKNGGTTSQIIKGSRRSDDSLERDWKIKNLPYDIRILRLDGNNGSSMGIRRKISKPHWLTIGKRGRKGGLVVEINNGELSTENRNQRMEQTRKINGNHDKKLIENHIRVLK